MRKPTKKSLQTKCDALLTPIIKLLFPTCLLCGRPTEVAHHHVHKSKSLRLRYELDNLINLCNSCHYSLHQNESYHASRIVEIKGLDWFRKLNIIKNEIVKWGIPFYENKLKELQQMSKGTVDY